MPVPLPLSADMTRKLATRTARNSEWASAIFVLTSPRFVSDQRVWRHVDDDLGGISFRDILAEPSWSTGERLLLELAASLFGAGVELDAGRLLAMGSSGRLVARGAVMAYLAAESLASARPR